MKIHKLSAISSTNDFLKDLVLITKPKNYTIVFADYQTDGRGQLEKKWHSEDGKNLLFSLLLKIKDFDATRQICLNYAISLAIFKVLNDILTNVKIKWPNDIMSRQKKICGLLIENTIKNDKIEHSIVGIGLNVNQVDFPKYLKNVSSLKLEAQQDFDRDELLKKIVEAIKIQIKRIENNTFNDLKKEYKAVLYKAQIPAMFKDKNDIIFMGKIIDVSSRGKLQIELDDESIKEFDAKDVKFLTN
jgi:BirA family biotin operon repressor/biotin-[acetyl-CoA-carboxylase] ligase